MNSGEPPPGVLFALALAALITAISALGVFAAWWLVL